MIFILVTSIGEPIMATLFAPFVRHVLHGSSQAYGVIAGVQAIGGVLGGLLVASLAHRVSASQLLSWGAVAFGAVDLGIFLYPLGYVAVWPAAAGMVLVGVPGAMTIAGAMTLFQRHTEDAYRGRVFGALNTVEGVAVLAGIVGAGFLGQVAGIVPVLAAQGGGYVVAGLVMLIVLRREPRASRQRARPARARRSGPHAEHGAGRTARPVRAAGSADGGGRQAGAAAARASPAGAAGTAGAAAARASPAGTAGTAGAAAARPASRPASRAS